MVCKVLILYLFQVLSGNSHDYNRCFCWLLLRCGWFWMGLHSEVGQNKVDKLQTAVRTTSRYKFGLSRDA